MKTIDKIRCYIRSISSTEDAYNKLLNKIWINPEQRMRECKHPEQETCAGCPLNYFRKERYVLEQT